MKNFKIKAILTLLVIVLAGLYYYVTLPAINIHASGFWGFLIGLVVLVLVLYLGTEIYNGLAVSDNISNLTHIIGGLCGSVIGYSLNRNRKL